MKGQIVLEKVEKQQLQGGGEGGRGGHIWNKTSRSIWEVGGIWTKSFLKPKEKSSHGKWQKREGGGVPE